MTFIDRYSWKCLLGPQSKDIKENKLLSTWRVRNKTHIVLFEPLEDTNILENYIPLSFYYIELEDLNKIKKVYKVKSTKVNTTCIDLTKIDDLKKRKYKSLRRKINSCKEYNLEILDDYKSINDLYEMIKIWNADSGDKYFRNFSGKNKYFYSSGFHKDCINSFCYDKGKLVAFGSLSPNNNGNSSFIIGKALNYKYNGLSEFLDFSLYKKAIRQGVKVVNLGASYSTGIKNYKNKWFGSFEKFCYEGKIL